MEDFIFCVVTDHGYDGISDMLLFSTEGKAIEYANGYKLGYEECVYVLKKKIDQPDFKEETGYLRLKNE